MKRNQMLEKVYCKDCKLRIDSESWVSRFLLRCRYDGMEFKDGLYCYECGDKKRFLGKKSK